MKINNSTEFFHFIKNQGLINLSPEVSQFVQCVEQQMRMCPCDSETVRRAKVEQCRRLYSVFLSRASTFKEQLLVKCVDNSLVLCSDGQTVVTLSR